MIFWGEKFYWSILVKRCCAEDVLSNKYYQKCTYALRTAISSYFLVFYLFAWN